MLKRTQYSRRLTSVLSLKAEACDGAGLVRSRPLDKWRETLALLAAYSDAEEFCGLCDLLAKRLAGAGLPQAATLTWICAANVDKAVRQWSADLKKSPRETSTEELQVCTSG